MIVEFYAKCPECGFEAALGRKETKDEYLEIKCSKCKYRFTRSDLFVSAEYLRQHDDVVQQTIVKYYIKDLPQLDSIEFLKTIPIPQILFPDDGTLKSMFSIYVEEKDDNDGKAS